MPLARWNFLRETIISSKDEIEVSYDLCKSIKELVSQMKLYEYEVRFKVPSEAYRDWIAMVRDAEEQAKVLEVKLGKNSMMTFIKRSSLVQEMRKLVQKVDQLKEAGGQLEDRLFLHSKLVPVVRNNEAPDIRKFGTLQKPLEKILDFLKNDAVNKLGIYGPLGIGKTTIMWNLNNHEEVARLFDIVIWVKASTEGSRENSSMNHIRKVVCQRLGLEFKDGYDVEEVKRAIALELDDKKYLLLLDDVKEVPNLEEIGLPDYKNGSKVVLTTRLRHVCSLTVDIVIKVSYLSAEEAWKMFQDVIKHPVLIKDSKIGPLAWRVCKECGGFPLLIEKVASAFRLKNKENDWVDGLKTWKIWPEEERQGIKEIYNLLKFCYDDLDDDYQKKCFLYMALYPEDSHIYSDNLLECWEAEDLLPDKIMSGHLVLSRLKNASLLEQGKTEQHVTMNKFMRLVALNILEDDSESKNLVKTNGSLCKDLVVKLGFGNHRISLCHNELHKLPDSPNCKELHTLFLQKNMTLSNIPASFFTYMENLRVLDLSDTGITSLPPSLLMLINLKILYLNNCKHLESLPTDIKKLKHLEILDIRGSGIFRIPDCIANLINLRRLRVSLSKSRDTDVAPEGLFNHRIFSKLSRLEELTVDVDAPAQLSNELVEKIMNAVATLKNFKALKFSFPDKVIDVMDVSHGVLFIRVPEVAILLSFIARRKWRKIESIKSFQLFIGSQSSEQPEITSFFRYDKYVKYCNGKGNNFPIEVISVSDAFELVNHNGIKHLSDIEMTSMNGLQACLVKSCDSFETVVNSAKVVLPNLERLYLKNLPKLKSICEGSLQGGSLNKVRTLVLTRCHLLSSIFPSGVIEQLYQIEHLTIYDCAKVVYIYTTVPSSDVLPNLRKLKLHGNQKLKAICETNAPNWPSLEKLQISNCPQLVKLPFNEFNAPELSEIKAEQHWWDSLQWKNEETKEHLQKFCRLSVPSYDELNSSRKEKFREYPKHQLEEELRLEDSPTCKASLQRQPKSQWEKEHSNSEDFAVQKSTIGYNNPDEGRPTSFLKKDDSIHGTSPEEDRVTSQELDPADPSSSKAYDDIDTIDWSYKSIKCLPKDISKYVVLRELKLKSCKLLMELGPEIGKLPNLEVLDLQGTEIICLPKEITKLINLRSLKFSLSGYADQFRKGSIIPQKALSNLLHLNELSIEVNPHGSWWNAEVKTVIDDLRCLKELENLCLCIPTVDLLGYLIQRIKLLIDQGSVCFRFTVGYHEERLTSRLPQEVQKEFHDLEKFKKGLKFTNGEGMPIEITNALEHVDAFLLERHWSIKNLLEFGMKNIDNLKCCILVECNELQTLIDTKQYRDFSQTILGSLQHLSIHYMKSMQKIWRGPVTEGSLSNLKSLALYSCVSLTTVFKIDMLANLTNLEELRIEDCPKIKQLASSSFFDLMSQDFLPNLKSMLLLELPGLRSISSGLSIAPKLERLVIFYCPKLRKLSKTEISSKDLKVLKGEKGWWDALKWYESDVSEADQKDLTDIFVPLKEDGDLEEQFLSDKNYLKLQVEIESYVDGTGGCTHK